MHRSIIVHDEENSLAVGHNSWAILKSHVRHVETNPSSASRPSKTNAAILHFTHAPLNRQMKDALGEALLSFRLLKAGGVMIFDDNWMRGVVRATAALEEAFGDLLQVLHRDEVGPARCVCISRDTV